MGSWCAGFFQIAVQERNAVANWMRARDWERRIVQQSRENAYLKHRLRMIDGEMLPVGPTCRGPMPGRPEFQKPLWQGREHDVKCSSLISAVKPHGAFPIPGHLPL
ncbi:transport and Golgi organization protein 1 homolog [Neovison vison]|uniref:transport and Golgi organization protein 1 homolog n=1 Tax=Neovison vison TaxID=452646 RepID=UPI001CF0C333|nr:transport and Golgi organization protein 1 homolog [Neogale vison]